MHTCFVATVPEAAAVVKLEKREHDHLFKTLRCRPGEELRLCDGRGTSARAAAMPERTLKVLERMEHQRDGVRLHLYAAQPKAARLDDLLKPMAEAGFASLTPLLCRYSVARRETPPERWTLLLIEGCKQSGNPFLPEIHAALDLPSALREIRERGMTAFFGKPGGVLWTGEGLVAGATVDIAWLVGPEGGFAPEEEALLEAGGARGIGLGPYIMRLETAALAGGVYLAQIARRMLMERGRS